MNYKLTFAILASTLLLTTGSVVGFADGLEQKGRVKVTNSGTSEIIDPEEPEEIVDPGVIISTKGDLRFDRLPNIDFGTMKISKKNRNYNALAEKIPSGFRGSFVQVSDHREKSNGWVIQLKQDYQFRTADYDELSGAVLSLDKGWANSTSPSDAPTVTRNTLSINNIGESYEVARANKDGGRGVWSVSFGSSGENDDGQKSTLSEDKTQKKIPRNNAVSLKVPDGTPIVPKEYQTKLTWTISSAP